MKKNDNSRKDLSTSKKILFSVILIFLMAIFVIVALEILMIILEPYIFTGFYKYDPDMGFKVRAYSHGTNRFGFMDRDYPLEKPEGVIRILIVGDSFGWIGGEKENYTAVLERMFIDYFEDNTIEVINTGYPMTHTGEQLPMLKKFGLQYDPDIVFLGFFVGNDFVDADPYRKRVVVNDTYFDIDKRHERTLFGYPIIAKSRLKHFINQKFKEWKELRKANGLDFLEAEEVTLDDHGCTFTKETYLEVQYSRINFCSIKANAEGKYDKNIDYIFQSIFKMNDLLDEKNIDFHVGIYPDEFQIDGDLPEKIAYHYNMDLSDIDIDFPQRILIKFLEEINIPYIDLLDIFREAGKNETLYLCRDTHWNRRGNELAAEIIFNYLLPIIETKMMASLKKSKIRCAKPESLRRIVIRRSLRGAIQ